MRDRVYLLVEDERIREVSETPITAAVAYGLIDGTRVFYAGRALNQMRGGRYGREKHEVKT